MSDRCAPNVIDLATWTPRVLRGKPGILGRGFFVTEPDAAGRVEVYDQRSGQLIGEHTLDLRELTQCFPGMLRERGVHPDDARLYRCLAALSALGLMEHEEATAQAKWVQFLSFRRLGEQPKRARAKRAPAPSPADPNQLGLLGDPTQKLPWR